MRVDLKRVVVIVMVALVTGCQTSEYIPVEFNSPAVVNKELVESIGIETLGGVFTPILSKGCLLPCERAEVFSTAEDNQSQVVLSLFRGNQGFTADSTDLGRYELTGFPLVPRGEPRIRVTFLVNNRGIFLSAQGVNVESNIVVRRIELGEP